MDAKRYVSVICEYNPFHYGHEFQLDTLKNRFDGVICIMSGDLVQRGSVAVAGKYLRAKAALVSGADLVLELPAPWCCVSARDFALAGVHIAESIGSHSLAFGAEDGETLLFNIYNYISKPEFSKDVKTYIEDNGNISYPQALCALVKNELGDTAAEAVKKPNNILALEYLTALSGKNTKPFFVKRQPEFCSSSEIRSAKDGKAMLSLLPSRSASVFETALGSDFPRDGAKLDSFFIGTLRRMASEGKMPNDIYSVPNDLVQKILSASVKYSSIDRLVYMCSDRIHTSARIRRAINAIVFGITAERVHKFPPYTCVLAANAVGREILRNAKSADIDIITKPAHALALGDDTKEAFLFAKGIEDIISLSAPQPLPADIGKVPYIV